MMSVPKMSTPAGATRASARVSNRADTFGSTEIRPHITGSFCVPGQLKFSSWNEPTRHHTDKEVSNRDLVTFNPSRQPFLALIVIDACAALSIPLRLGASEEATLSNLS